MNGLLNTSKSMEPDVSDTPDVLDSHLIRYDRSKNTVRKERLRKVPLESRLKLLLTGCISSSAMLWIGG